jgi:mannitol-1-phosphate/altronate dehydrogenase
MESATNEVQAFQQYAEQKLKQHRAELNTRYENEKIDDGTKRQAYLEHEKIYTQELDQKLGNIKNIDKSSHLYNALETIKRSYIKKLKQNNG